MNDGLVVRRSRGNGWRHDRGWRRCDRSRSGRGGSRSLCSMGMRRVFDFVSRNRRGRRHDYRCGCRRNRSCRNGWLGCRRDGGVGNDRGGCHDWRWRGGSRGRGRSGGDDHWRNGRLRGRRRNRSVCRDGRRHSRWNGCGRRGCNGRWHWRRSRWSCGFRCWRWLLVSGVGFRMSVGIRFCVGALGRVRVEDGQLLLQKFGRDFIQRTRRNFGSNAQFFGFGKNLFAFYSNLFC